MLNDRLRAAAPAARPVPPTRTAILVAGMHRAGTSALTRLLSLLGADLPSQLIPANAANPLGYWEPAPIVRLHDQALASAGVTWDDPGRIPAAWFDSAAAARLAAALHAEIARDFAGSRLFVVKDPRLCRLLPLWRRVLAEAGVKARVLIPIRHPLDVAASLAARDGLDRATSLRLWLRYVLDAEHGSRGLPRRIVLFDDLLQDWRASVDRIRSEVWLDLQPADAGQAVAIDDFLSPAHRHHAAAEAGLELADRAVAATYAALAAARGGQPLPTTLLDRLRAEIDGGGELDAVLVRLDSAGRARARLQDEAAALRRELDAIRASRCWRLTAPLRTLRQWWRWQPDGGR